MRLRPLRSDVKRMWRPSWEIHGSSSLALVLSSLIGASDDANGELASARVAWKRSPRLRSISPPTNYLATKVVRVATIAKDPTNPTFEAAKRWATWHAAKAAAAE